MALFITGAALGFITGSAVGVLVVEVVRAMR